MKRRNEHGLTPLEERFCHEFIRGEYSSDGGDTLVTAYRKAAGCFSEGEKAKGWHYCRASELMKKGYVQDRIAVIRKQRNELLSLSHAEYVSEDAWLMQLDPMELMIFDKKINAWRLRRIYEMSAEIRRRVPFRLDNKGRYVPNLDKNLVKDRLMKALGFSSEKKEVEFNMQDGVRIIEFGEFPDSLLDENSDKM